MMSIHLQRKSSTLRRLPYPRAMPSLYIREIFCLLIFATLCGKSSAFLSGAVGRLHRQNPITATSRTSYTDQLHWRGMLGALRMAGEDAAESPEATAKRLAEQAAVLREEVAAREAELRPPEQRTQGAEEPAPEIRPEDRPPTIKISDEMKSRLRQELISQGADPNKSAGNPILVISAVIAILVIIGGKGIFY